MIRLIVSWFLGGRPVEVQPVKSSVAIVPVEPDWDQETIEEYMIGIENWDLIRYHMEPNYG